MPILSTLGAGSAKSFGLTRNLLSGPTSPVTGYRVWLDASDSSTITLSSGSNCSQWRDKSSNGYTWSQNTTLKQPQWNTRTQNGKALMDFNGGFGDKQALLSDSSNATWTWTNDGDGSYFIVFSADVAENSMLTNNPNGSPGVGFFWFTGAYAGWHLYRGVQGTSVIASGWSQPTMSTNTFYAMAALTDPTNGTPANRAYINLNGGTVYNQNTSSSSTSTSTPTGNLTIGGASNAPSNGDYFNGVIGEIIMYDSKLSDSDRDKNINYLKTKWGIL
jgi:hypothetical protein